MQVWGWRQWFNNNWIMVNNQFVLPECTNFSHRMICLRSIGDDSFPLRTSKDGRRQSQEGGMVPQSAYGTGPEHFPKGYVVPCKGGNASPARHHIPSPHRLSRLMSRQPFRWAGCSMTQLSCGAMSWWLHSKFWVKHLRNKEESHLWAELAFYWMAQQVI